MKTFNNHLKESLSDPDFKDLYTEERKLIELSIQIHEVREKSGLSQSDVARMAHVTQQQLSKIENGKNCNMITYLKVCNALGLDFIFSPKAAS
ncbi:MAG: helix-turn-helix transcriptional regulator [Spirochaetales bacterium]|nr:helix-turn-helix transcriptional regulator [Spirochaetales bacterium]